MCSINVIFSFWLARYFNDKVLFSSQNTFLDSWSNQNCRASFIEFQQKKPVSAKCLWNHVNHRCLKVNTASCPPLYITNKYANCHNFLIIEASLRSLFSIICTCCLLKYIFLANTFWHEINQILQQSLYTPDGVPFLLWGYCSSWLVIDFSCQGVKSFNKNGQ